MARGLALAAVLCAGAGGLVPGPAAEACGNAVELSRSKVTKMLADAEAALAAGRHQRIIDTLDKDGTMMAMGRLWFVAPDAKLACRAKVVIGMAYIRAKAEYAVETAASIESCLRATPDDPLLRARDAEVNVYAAGVTERMEPKWRDQYRADARATLEDLATKDLLAEPEAWATLARLRADAGENTGAAKAAKACRKMTKRKGVCPRVD